MAASGLNGALLQSLYLSSKNWLLYMEFFDDEFRFFKNQLIRYFVTDSGEDKVEYTHIIDMRLNELEKHKAEVLSNITNYQARLKEYIRNSSHGSKELADEYFQLEQLVKNLQPALEQIKMERYSYTEEALKKTSSSTED